MRVKYTDTGHVDFTHGSIYDAELDGDYYQLTDDVGDERCLPQKYFTPVTACAEDEDTFDSIVPTAPQIQGHDCDVLITDDIKPEDPVMPRYKPEVW